MLGGGGICRQFEQMYLEGDNEEQKNAFFTSFMKLLCNFLLKIQKIVRFIIILFPQDMKNVVCVCGQIR